jgi:hypothetical protein
MALALNILLLYFLVGGPHHGSRLQTSIHIHSSSRNRQSTQLQIVSDVHILTLIYRMFVKVFLFDFDTSLLRARSRYRFEIHIN